MNEKEIMEKLQAPFTPDEIEWRVGVTNGKPKANPPVPATKGIALAYVTNRAIQNRLDDVFGCFGWQNQYKEWKGASQICGISVYSEYHNAWITKWDGADDSQTEAVKGGLSDSMKRAAYQWGIGRYLYNLPQTWVNLKDGRYLAEIPKLPAWALPSGYKDTKGKTSVEMPIDITPKPKEETPKKNEEFIPQCTECKKEISKAEHDYSVKKYLKPLCRTCQSKTKVGA